MKNIKKVSCKICGKTHKAGTRQATRDFVFADVCIGCNKRLGALDALENDRKVDYDIGYRGGHYTIDASDALYIAGFTGDYDEKCAILESLPGKIGAGCNYLGGGLRGAIVGTVGSADEFVKHGVPEKYAQKLFLLVKAIKQRYEDIENGMNDEYDAYGEPNWDAIGTNANRRAGVTSAY